VTSEETIQYWSDGELEITIAGDPEDLSRAVSIQVVDPGYWLVYCWFVDGDAITEQETLTPPATPGTAHFHKVTDASGLLEFTIENDPAWQGRLCAVLVGRATISDVIVVGV
jgi:hypothetical protein